MTKHFVVVNEATEIIEGVMTMEGDEPIEVEKGYFYIEIPYHEPKLFGKNYKDINKVI